MESGHTGLAWDIRDLFGTYGTRDIRGTRDRRDTRVVEAGTREENWPEEAPARPMCHGIGDLGFAETHG